ncbi:MAG TPA: hypothetical protein G4O18_03075 [Dehalococcoidia bacterium]|nr:hypothetical protein [Dehalococcoidia bacterium]
MGDTAIEVLKWVGIVFAAGFIGYFGRHLAMMLIEKMRHKKSEPPAPEAPATPPPSPSEIAATTQAKVDKKRAKAEAKRAKKEKA